jgi:hypothetical protein
MIDFNKQLVGMVIIGLQQDKEPINWLFRKTEWVGLLSEQVPFHKQETE